MRIKKITQTPLSTGEAQVLDGYSTSTTDSYSCDYVNGLIQEHLLYNNTSGSTSITLSEDVSNYKYLEIYLKDEDGSTWCEKVYVPLLTTTGIRAGRIQGGGSAAYLWYAKISISGTSITVTDTKRWQGWTSQFGSPFIKVFRVVGYK